MKTCQKCNAEVRPGEKFCTFHKRQMLEEMKAAGYLTKPLKQEKTRPDSAREAIRQTKRGIDD